jgi:prepilin-type N-terminal cleavage/methylation domain-containing protein
MASGWEKGLRREVAGVKSVNLRLHPSHLTPCLRRRAGVTLTEVVVASALLAVAIVPLLQTLTLAQVQDRAIERISWSVLLAQQEL